MYRLMNQGNRVHILKAEQILKGGKLHIDKKSSDFSPGMTIEVDDETGELLSSYAGIMVLSKSKKFKEEK